MWSKLQWILLLLTINVIRISVGLRKESTCVNSQADNTKFSRQTSDPNIRTKMSMMPLEQVERILDYVFTHAKKGEPDSVIQAIDNYTETLDEIVINIGDKKGAVMDAVIINNKPKILAEMGGFFGYSAIRFAALARKYNPSSHYYSVEINPVLACVIESMAKFAGLDGAITVLLGDLTRTLLKLKEELNGATVDFFFLDHLKSMYVSDLQLAVKEGILKRGAVVVADNIIRPGAPAYKIYMETETKMYSSKFQQIDGDAIIISTLN